MPDGFRVVLHREDVLVEPLIHALQHGVVLNIFSAHGKIFFNTRNAVEIHVLCNLDGICAPRRYHLTAGPDEKSFDAVVVYQFGIAIQPAQLIGFLRCQPMVCLCGNNAFGWGFEKKNHTLLFCF